MCDPRQLADGRQPLGLNHFALQHGLMVQFLDHHPERVGQSPQLTAVIVDARLHLFRHATRDLSDAVREPHQRHRRALSPVPVDRQQYRENQRRREQCALRDGVEARSERILGVGQHQRTKAHPVCADRRHHEDQPGFRHVDHQRFAFVRFVQPQRQCAILISQRGVIHQHGKTIGRARNIDLFFLIQYRQAFHGDAILPIGYLKRRPENLERPPDIVMQHRLEQRPDNVRARLRRHDGVVLDVGVGAGDKQRGNRKCRGHDEHASPERDLVAQIERNFSIGFSFLAERPHHLGHALGLGLPSTNP